MIRALLRTTSLMLLGCLLVGCQAIPSGSSAGSTIVETMDSGGYSYVKVMTNGKATWYAVPECEVAVGDLVAIEPGAMAMKDFESSTLKRKFALIYFASGLEKVGQANG